MGTAIKHPEPDRVKLSLWHLGTLTLSRERQSAQMSQWWLSPVCQSPDAL